MKSPPASWADPIGSPPKKLSVNGLFVALALCPGLISRRRDLNVFSSVRRRRPLRRDDSFGSRILSALAPSGPDACGSCFLALQPIFNRRREIFGYEALARSG